LISVVLVLSASITRVQMASIVASLLPPLLLPARNSHPGTFPTFPVSLLSGNPFVFFQC